MTRTTFWAVPADGPIRGLVRRRDDGRVLTLDYWDGRRWVADTVGLGFHFHHGGGWDVDHDGIRRVGRLRALAIRRRLR